MDRHGREQAAPLSEYEVGYRHGHPAASGGVVRRRRSCSFEHKPGINEARVRELLERRRASQPIGEWSCGSVFTNPPGDHAARLVEAAGLKGYRIGDASVSEKHANFIINHGQCHRGRPGAVDRARAGHG